MKLLPFYDDKDIILLSNETYTRFMALTDQTEEEIRFLIRRISFRVPETGVEFKTLLELLSMADTAEIRIVNHDGYQYLCKPETKE